MYFKRQIGRKQSTGDNEKNNYKNKEKKNIGANDHVKGINTRAQIHFGHIELDIDNHGIIKQEVFTVL